MGWLPLPAILDVWQVERDPNRPQLFEAMFVFHDAGPAKSAFRDLAATFLSIDASAAPCDVLLFVVDQPDGLTLHLECGTAIGEAEASRLLTSLVAEFERLASGDLPGKSLVARFALNFISCLFANPAALRVSSVSRLSILPTRLARVACSAKFSSSAISPASVTSYPIHPLR
jgi:hypothetical protein